MFHMKQYMARENGFVDLLNNELWYCLLMNCGVVY